MSQHIGAGRTCSCRSGRGAFADDPCGSHVAVLIEPVVRPGPRSAQVGT